MSEIELKNYLAREDGQLGRVSSYFVVDLLAACEALEAACAERDELLAALLRVTEALAARIHDRDDCHHDRTAVLIARAAIAKARGES